MPYRVIQVLEVDPDDWEPPPLTVQQRIERAIDGILPCAAGNDSLFTINGSS